MAGGDSPENPREHRPVRVHRDDDLGDVRHYWLDAPARRLLTQLLVGHGRVHVAGPAHRVLLVDVEHSSEPPANGLANMATLFTPVAMSITPRDHGVLGEVAGHLDRGRREVRAGFHRRVGEQLVLGLETWVRPVHQAVSGRESKSPVPPFAIAAARGKFGLTSPHGEGPFTSQAAAGVRRHGGRRNWCHRWGVDSRHGRKPRPSPPLARCPPTATRGARRRQSPRSGGRLTVWWGVGVSQ